MQKSRATDFRYEFHLTPYGTFRVNMYFDNDNMSEAVNSQEFNLFEILSVWGGYDKVEKNMFSWELPMSLIPYIEDRFKTYPFCKIQLR